MSLPSVRAPSSRLALLPRSSTIVNQLVWNQLTLTIIVHLLVPRLPCGRYLEELRV